MNREAQDTLLLFVGVMVLQVGITDLHLRYVKPQMQPLLIAAGLVLTVLAVVSIVRMQRGSRAVQAEARTDPTQATVPAGAVTGVDAPRDGGPHDGDDGDSHGHGAHRMPRTAWLLALPLLVLALVTPPSLGAYAASRGDSTIEQPRVVLPDLDPPREGAVDLSLTDYATRAVYAPESVQGQQVRLTGFVVPQDGGWAIGRMKLSCCAADGRPVKVRVEGQAAPAGDTWVEVVGSYVVGSEPGASNVAVAADRLRFVDPPAQEYE